MYRLDGGNRPPGKDWNCSLTCRTTVLAARIAKAWMAKGVAVPQRVSTGSGGDMVAEMKTETCLSERGLSGMSAPKQAYRDDSGTDGEGVLVEKVSSTPHHHTHTPPSSLLFNVLTLPGPCRHPCLDPLLCRYAGRAVRYWPLISRPHQRSMLREHIIVDPLFCFLLCQLK